MTAFQQTSRRGRNNCCQADAILWCTGVPKNLMVLFVVLCVVSVWPRVAQTGLVWLRGGSARSSNLNVAVQTSQ
jgi:hypothetical protein